MLGIERHMRHLAFYALPLLAAGCSGMLFEEQDSAPGGQVDVSAVPDAVPRVEPLSKYGNPPSYEVNGKSYTTLARGEGYVERGIASWYGTKFHGRRTSSGEAYDMYAMSAAHKTLPLPSYVEVTNLDNGRKVIVKVNDRGPFHEGRIIDLSYVAAIKLGISDAGTGRVEVRSITPGAGAKKPEEPQAPVLAEDRSGLYLQVATFTQWDNAHRFLQRLQQAAIENLHISEQRAEHNPLYKVRIGPLSSRLDADRLMQRLLPLGIENPFVVVD